MLTLNTNALVFLVFMSTTLVLVPRRWAPLPFLVGACYMTLGQGIEIGQFSFTMVRLLIAVGLVRVLIRKERPAGPFNALDWLIIAWAIWALLSLAFHSNPSGAFNSRLGRVYSTCGIYFLLRCFCRTREDLEGLVRITAILLVPLSLAMYYEWSMGHNLFSTLGGVPETPQFRSGGFRAQGPFAHAILAGTVGAVCIPLFIGLWSKWRFITLIGVSASIIMILTSGSSGPILSAMAGVLALFLWYLRHAMHIVRRLAIFGYIFLDIVMNAPAYYLIARIDLTGGSTGYHRARLIEMSIQHLNEWWFAGTDYTRHWMPYGVSWSPDHADITNQYIFYGVVAGLPLMILFIIQLFKAFNYVGRVIKTTVSKDSETQFFVWSLGAALFAHAATMLSVSYFDQSYIFLYMVLAAIGSLYSTSLLRSP